MLNLKNKLKNLLTKKESQKELAFKKEVASAVLQLTQTLENTNSHLIAIARLSFISPETIVREAKNYKANGEYLLKMVEALKGKENEKTK